MLAKYWELFTDPFPSIVKILVRTNQPSPRSLIGADEINSTVSL